MAKFELPFVKDLGLQRKVMDALPYAVVGGAYMASMDEDIAQDSYRTLLNYVVPAGQQLKILFLRVWTQNTSGAKFSIHQKNPATAGLTGATEAFPVVGSVPPYSAGYGTYRDYPMLAAAGCETLTGNLRQPIHVLEGSIDFNLYGPLDAAMDGDKYGIVWWGVIKIPE